MFFICNPAVNTDIDGYASGKCLCVFVSKESALYLTMSAQPCWYCGRTEASWFTLNQKPLWLKQIFSLFHKSHTSLTQWTTLSGHGTLCLVRNSNEKVDKTKLQLDGSFFLNPIFKKIHPNIHRNLYYFRLYLKAWAKSTCKHHSLSLF